MFPWAASGVNGSTTLDEFMDLIRYNAIDVGAPPAFLDLVEELRENLAGASELENMDQVKTDLEEATEKIAKLETELATASAKIEAIQNIVKD